jgi:hypothetical protein
MPIANNMTTDLRLPVRNEAEASSADRPQDSREHSPNVRWQHSALSREQRWQSLGHAGATVWFTGLPAAGKSTIAGALEERLSARGAPPSYLMATTYVTGSTATSASTSQREARTCAAQHMSQGCWQSLGRWPSLAWSVHTRRIGKAQPHYTQPPASPSLRYSSTLRCDYVSSVTQRDSMRAPVQASSPV